MILIKQCKCSRYPFQPCQIVLSRLCIGPIYTSRLGGVTLKITKTDGGEFPTELYFLERIILTLEMLKLTNLSST